MKYSSSTISIILLGTSVIQFTSGFYDDSNARKRFEVAALSKHEGRITKKAETNMWNEGTPPVETRSLKKRKATKSPESKFPVTPEAPKKKMKSPVMTKAPKKKTKDSVATKVSKKKTKSPLAEKVPKKTKAPGTTKASKKQTKINSKRPLCFIVINSRDCQII